MKLVKIQEETEEPICVLFTAHSGSNPRPKAIADFVVVPKKVCKRRSLESNTKIGNFWSRCVKSEPVCNN